MNVCIPIEAFEGLDSKISLHFSRGARFLLLDTDTRYVYPLPAPREEAPNCRPLDRIVESGAREVWCRRIGFGAANNLHLAGILVREAPAGRVGDVLDQHLNDRLPLLSAEKLCLGEPDEPGNASAKEDI